MRISDWSSDVCSSDLIGVEIGRQEDAAAVGDRGGHVRKMRGDRTKRRKLIAVCGAPGFVGAGEMGHQQPKVELAGQYGVGGERDGIARRQTEARHAAVELKGSGRESVV